MSEPNFKEIEPLFLAFGHAVFAAQLLESGMRLLLFVVEHERDKAGLPKLQIHLDDPNQNKTLGTLFKEVLTVEYITEAENKII